MGEIEELSNNEIDDSPRGRSHSYRFRKTPCTFDFLHATAQEMDSRIPPAYTEEDRGERRREKLKLARERSSRAYILRKFGENICELDTRVALVSREI